MEKTERPVGKKKGAIEIGGKKNCIARDDKAHIK
jgi:hypothetical protein